jgi:MoxR-like ATPase
MKFSGSSKYYLSPDLSAIVNMAIKMEKPLLLTGEPGTGKTQLAFEIGKELGMHLEIMRAKSTIKGEESCYVQDTVLRLNDARFGTTETGRNVNNFFDYVIWGPIGRSFLSEERVVLLLDEIDKTEADVQDNLLDVLEDCEFTIREVNKTVKAIHRPVIIITSNAKRELSDPFLRRCFCHHIAFPKINEMREIINLHFPDLEKGLLDAALNIFYELRERGFEKAPATSELLNWLEALQNEGTIPQDKNNIPLPGILLKRTVDIVNFRNGVKSKPRNW